MHYFVGIVPPQAYKDRIEAFRNRWESNRLQEVVEPHITVKAQGGLTDDLRWLDEVRAVCRSMPGFRLSIAEPASYGNAVVFLSVQSEAIYALHKRLVDAVSPSPELIKRYFEGNDFHPHLTLGQTRWGMNEAELEQLKLASSAALAPFPTFPVTFVRVYQETEPNKYVPFEDIQLAAAAD